MTPLFSISDEGLLVIAPEPTRCPSCGQAAVVFVNRDGASRCSAKCDSEYLKQKEADLCP
jgi:hypothetical protein